MLTLTSQQYEILEQAQRRRVIMQAYTFLCTQFPDASKEQKNDMLDNIDQLFTRATSYGLTTKAQLYVYLVAAWSLGMEFDTRFSEAKAILIRTDLSSESKRGWISNWVLQVLHDNNN